jgi:hypothetical protein
MKYDPDSIIVLKDSKTIPNNITLATKFESPTFNVFENKTINQPEPKEPTETSETKEETNQEFQTYTIIIIIFVALIVTIITMIYLFKKEKHPIKWGFRF